MKKLNIHFKIILAAVVAAGALMSCGPKFTEKPKYLWFDAEANFDIFAHQDSIRYYLDKAKQTGFNHIAVDIRPIIGQVLYKSDFLPQLTTFGDLTVNRDWDYLQFFIDEARKRKLKVTVSTTIFPVGRAEHQDGLCYETDEYDDRLCLEYYPEGMISVKDDRNQVAAFLNPAMPENRDFGLRIIDEVISKYDIDGYALDYCRYGGAVGDYSEFSRRAFEEYIGEEVPNFPEDIFTYAEDGSRVEGPYYRQWWVWRSMVIHDFVKSAKELIQSKKPDIKLEYWAASWINSLYQNGQNWGSKKYDYSQNPFNSDWASPEYSATGFAEHLDIFLLGTYLDVIWGIDDPESIEFGIKRAQDIIQGDCQVYGTIYAKNHEHNVADAVYVCLANSEGLMVFDIVQVREYNIWDDIKEGIDRYEAEEKEKLKNR